MSDNISNDMSARIQAPPVIQLVADDFYTGAKALLDRLPEARICLSPLDPRLQSRMTAWTVSSLKNLYEGMSVRSATCPAHQKVLFALCARQESECYTVGSGEHCSIRVCNAADMNPLTSSYWMHLAQITFVVPPSGPCYVQSQGQRGFGLRHASKDKSILPGKDLQWYELSPGDYVMTFSHGLEMSMKVLSPSHETDSLQSDPARPTKRSFALPRTRT
ncbi:hypothetical protein BDZ85DRAFT_57855 [Elsinoe ampelina]|uniref:Uncharacterized protein n=1 Tax=Elsinoe ampelina TaxID=302913 RepID=A0A6A6GNW5_9PEZI|nr:hypothetical protein BDZ85DRAFT_57855 [Elsinoe ampelina]